MAGASVFVWASKHLGEVDAFGFGSWFLGSGSGMSLGCFTSLYLETVIQKKHT